MLMGLDGEGFKGLAASFSLPSYNASALIAFAFPSLALIASPLSRARHPGKQPITSMAFQPSPAKKLLEQKAI
jgi:hypothetical protein